MQKYRIGTWLALLASAGLLIFCLHGGTTLNEPPVQEIPILLPAVQVVSEPIQPIPQKLEGEQRMVALGRRLFHETLLSHNNTIACATCHDLAKFGTDGKPRSVGINGSVVAVNSPSVYNSGFNYKQFWNARANTLEDQADGPPQAAKEMGSSWHEIIDKLKQKPDYVTEFNAVFPEGITHDTICGAIAAFERTLTTPNCRFDRYLRGETSAINSEEKEGYLLFKSYGCTSCHQGTNAGGNMLAKFGVMVDYFTTREKVSEADYGRYNITKQEADRYVFKVPSLRNVTRTAPYFHDGSVTNLEDAVTVMARYQLGRTLEPKELTKIVKFLGTLEGEISGEKP